MAKGAIEAKFNHYETLYNNYYATEAYRSLVNWRQRFLDIAHGAKSPEEIEHGIDAEIDQYTEEYWVKSTPYNTLTDFKQGEDEITKNARADLVDRLHPVLESVRRKLAREAQDKLYTELQSMADALNTRLQIEVDVTSKGTPAGGAHVQFKVLADSTAWSGTTDKGGKFVLPCTVLGYLEAGAPTTVRVTVEDAGGEITKETSYKMAAPPATTIVKVDLGGTPDAADGGPWQGYRTCISDAQCPQGQPTPIALQARSVSPSRMARRCVSSPRVARGEQTVPVVRLVP